MITSKILVSAVEVVVVNESLDSAVQVPAVFLGMDAKILVFYSFPKFLVFGYFDETRTANNPRE